MPGIAFIVVVTSPLCTVYGAYLGVDFLPLLVEQLDVTLLKRIVDHGHAVEPGEHDLLLLEDEGWY